ncbi:putative receptor-like protein kinase [Cardamine amara subsp. amara]|uniref:Receptor-like protein kinase n=1 Tax=Cardamine amara subsp. amara TaxID=228776 RepID=A0ABD0ZVL3_CARAN
MFVKPDKDKMCLFRHLLFLLPIWVLGFSFFSVSLVIKAEDSVVSVSATSQEIPISQASQLMGAQSPGPPIVKVVLREDLNKKLLIALIVSSTLLCVTVMFLLYLLLWRYRNLNNSFTGIKSKSDSVKSVSTKPIVHKIDSVKKGTIPVYEYQLLESATNKFNDSNVLSRGGRGCLYRACLDEKSSVTVTVKKLDAGGETDVEKQFETEVDWLAKIRHQNIVSLLGFCVYRQTRCIVYELMQNGSLESQLHGPSHGSGLTWQLRMKIAVDIARGLEYLHEHCHPPVVHRDLKSSSILLDSDFNAKISDFGFATVLTTQNKNLSRASEYLLDGKVTDKNDVYSFGVILLELLLGKRSVEKPSSEPESIVTWAVPKLSDRANLPNILDPAIKGTMDLKHLYQVAAVAVLCVQPEPSYRPLITDVLHSLIPLLPVELGGSLRIL